MSLFQVVVILFAVAAFVIAQPGLFQDFQGGSVNTDVSADGAFEFLEAFTTPEGYLTGDATGGALNSFGIYGDDEVSANTTLQSAAINGNTFSAGLFSSNVTGVSFGGEGATANGTNFVFSSTTPTSAVTALFSDQSVQAEGPGETEISSSGSGVSVAQDVGSSAGFQVSGSDSDSGEDPFSNVDLTGFAIAQQGFSLSNSTACAGDSCP